MKRSRKNVKHVWKRVVPVGLFISLFLLISTGMIYAQKKELDKSDVPQSVVKAIETDFPRWEEINWYAFDEIANQWAAIKKQGKVRGVMPDYYVASASGRNISIEAVYDKNGKLIRSKTVIKNVKLPEPIMSSVKDEYPDWRIVSDQVVIRDFDKNKKYFQVMIRKENNEKTIYYNAQGNKVKRRNI